MQASARVILVLAGIFPCLEIEFETIAAVEIRVGVGSTWYEGGYKRGWLGKKFVFGRKALQIVILYVHARALPRAHKFK
jgi:hypothetical protein